MCDPPQGTGQAGIPAFVQQLVALVLSGEKTLFEEAFNGMTLVKCIFLVALTSLKL